MVFRMQSPHKPLNSGSEGRTPELQADFAEQELEVMEGAMEVRGWSKGQREEVFAKTTRNQKKVGPSGERM